MSRYKPHTTRLFIRHLFVPRAAGGHAPLAPSHPTRAGRAASRIIPLFCRLRYLSTLRVPQISCAHQYVYTRFEQRRSTSSITTTTTFPTRSHLPQLYKRRLQHSVKHIESRNPCRHSLTEAAEVRQMHTPSTTKTTESRPPPRPKGAGTRQVPVVPRSSLDSWTNCRPIEPVAEPPPHQAPR